jgi:hypothetical protein
MFYRKVSDENWHKVLNNETYTTYMYGGHGMGQSTDGVFSGISSINEGRALGTLRPEVAKVE